MTLAPRPIDDDTLRRLANAAGAAAIVCAAGLIWFDVYRPLTARRAHSRDEIAHLDELWRDRRRIEAAYVRQVAARDEAARDLERWTRRVPAVAAEAELLGQLSEAATGVGVRLDDFRIDGARTVAGCPALEARTSLRASFPDLCRFLDRIDHLPRLCRVERFHIDADDGVEPRHRVGLTLHAFYRPAAAAETSGR